MSTTRQLLSIVGVSVLTAGLGYCVYFDYKRRNDPIFRKKLLKEQRRVTKLKQAQGKSASREAEQVLAAAVAAINAEPLPTTKEGRENYFMEQVGMGETLASRMPQGAMPAAIAFFKAYKVYPSPQELMMIYQRTMPPEVFAILVEMIKQDVNQTISASKTSASTSRSRRSLSSDGPLIEEIINEEPGSKALKDNSTDPAPPSSMLSVPQSLTPSKPSGSAFNSSSNEASGHPTPTHPEDSLSHATLSENGSNTAESQTAHSFVLVDDDPSQASKAEPVEKPIDEHEVIKVESLPEEGLALSKEEVTRADDIHAGSELGDNVVTDPSIDSSNAKSAPAEDTVINA